jgi:hypothetical protein
MTRRLLSSLVAVAVAALALAGCATGSTLGPGAAPTDPGSSELTAPSGDFPVDAAWLAGGSMIALVTYGSSTPTCQPRLDGAVLDDGVLVVSLLEPEETSCDADLGPRSLLVGLPAGVDPAEGLDVQVNMGDAFAETALAAYQGGAAEEYQPSAGWAGDEHIAILTWGSSSCAPSIESTTVVSQTEVAVAFTTPAADQVCTMDMAPRVAIATIDGDVSRDATLTLGGVGAAPGGDASLPIG